MNPVLVEVRDLGDPNRARRVAPEQRRANDPGIPDLRPSIDPVGNSGEVEGIGQVLAGSAYRWAGSRDQDNSPGNLSSAPTPKLPGNGGALL